MVARLGFAVAAFVDPDVLLVDEVLSVGDVGFQDRSIRKMLSFRDSGQAVLFVSHNLSAVEMMCDRTAWLDHGGVRQIGPTADVVRAYLDAVDSELLAAESAEADTTGSVTIARVRICDRDDQPSNAFEFGDALRAKVHCVVRERVSQVECALTVRGDYGPLFSASSTFDAWEPGAHEVDGLFEELPLLPGLYRLEVELRYAEAASWDYPRSVSAFRIVTDLEEYGSDSVVGATKSRGGFLAVAYNWQVRTVAGEEHLAGLRLPRNMATYRAP
jgi:ABC-2 type transport system ATP-binding protein